MTGEQKNLYYEVYLQCKREIKRILKTKKLQDSNKIDFIKLPIELEFERQKL